RFLSLGHNKSALSLLRIFCKINSKNLFTNPRSQSMNTKALSAKRHTIKDSFIIGIDPAKAANQAYILSPDGETVGKSFKFKNNFKGFNTDLKYNLSKYLPDVPAHKIVFSIETSLNLWQKTAYFLHSQGYKVVTTSPLATSRERPKMNSFSRTDPRDAYSVANVAKNGYYNDYKLFDENSNAMHSLTINYDKLREDLTASIQRLRDEVEKFFPEISSQISHYDSETILYLLSKYLTPGEFRNINVDEEEKTVKAISYQSYRLLLKIKSIAKESIGLPLSPLELEIHKMIVSSHIQQIKLLKQLLKQTEAKLVELAKKTPHFKILTSIKGLSENGASRLIAELRDLSWFDNHRKIEAMAGLNLRLNDSGKQSGNRVISRIGNKRLRRLLYTIGEQIIRHIPEARIRFIKRQLKNGRYKKDIIAAISVLLKIIVSLIKGNRIYEFREQKIEELQMWEEKYQELEKVKKKKANQKRSRLNQISMEELIALAG
ncbi:MAG TPA: IS110 family transposase, partial [Candidatus Paceibacterota bacterium]|nr:IS110 family transposase [Candidatus Paceibacterota bacterium]